MINIYLLLFIQFFKIGVFSFGGGYATLPFLYEIAEKFHWYSISQLTDMLAVASLTPGPVGVNMATYAGFTTSGIVGALSATFAVMLPSFIIVSIVFKILHRFKSNLYIQRVVKALKPAGCALLSAVGIKLVLISGFIKKRDPIFYLGVSAIIGLIIGNLHWIGV